VALMENPMEDSVIAEMTLSSLKGLVATKQGGDFVACLFV
jgi:hypothetical protein